MTSAVRPRARERFDELVAQAGPGAATHVKLCGMRRDEDVLAVNEAAPDLCGFVVNVPGRRRSVTPAQLAGLVARLDRPAVLAVGVFVDHDPAGVAELVEAGLVDVVQLHGHEDEAYLAELRRLAPGVPLLQAARVAAPADLERAAASTADLVLLDNGAGGTGEAFDWGLLQGFSARPFVLAGGLSATNVAQAVRQVRPWGVDMSSGVEDEQGNKDISKMTAAVAAARSALQ